MCVSNKRVNRHKCQRNHIKSENMYMYEMSHDMKFPTMWYVRPEKAQTSLRIRAV